MNERNYRNEVNVIYCAPCRVVAAGEDRNLVQGSISNEEQEIKRLRKILDFGDPRQPVVPIDSTQIKKKITQGSMPNLAKEISTLDRVLKFGGKL